MKRTITNEAFGNPAFLTAFAKGDMHNAMVAATPGGIEAQEKAGQSMLTLKFNQLPKEGLDRYRAAIEAAGFKIGSDVDDLFVGVTAPAGWQLRPTSHSMHSDIVDDKGRERGGVFYKAAFYDRKAHFHLHTRYIADTEYEQDDSKEWEDRKSRTVAKDRESGTVLCAGEWQRNGDRNYSREDGERAKCVAHLDQHFPDWQNVQAYW